jgi:acetyl esterase/lipase
MDVEKKYKRTIKASIRAEKLASKMVFNLNMTDGVEIKRKIKYCDNAELYLNICQPQEKASSKLPVFIYLHGGGWIGGSPEGREAFTTRIASFGVFVVSVFYGLSPKYTHPVSVQNIYKAIEWLYDNEERLNIDLSNTFVGGESAGAHLSAIIGAISSNEEYKKIFALPQKSKDINFRGLFLNCGIYDISRVINSGFKHIKIFVSCYFGNSMRRLSKDKRLKEMSPINYVTKLFPNSYIITADTDKLADNSYRFMEKLEENGVNCTHYHGKGLLAMHAFPVSQILKITQEVMNGLEKFIRENTIKKGQ